jgi:hypothetical protein
MASLLKPPRRTGNDSADLINLFDWAGDLHSAIARDANLLNPAFAPLMIVELTLSGTQTQASYTFEKPRTDANYRVKVQAKDYSGLANPDALIVALIALSPEGFTVTFADAPGFENTASFDVFVYTT